MASHSASDESDPYRESFGDIEWADPEITDESRLMLEGLTRLPRRGSRRLDPRRSLSSGEAAENAREEAESSAAAITERLIELQVRGARKSNGVDSFTYRDIERFPDLEILLGFIDDVHYEVYRRRKEKSPSPYLTVGVNEILSELIALKETHVDPVNYQRDRSKQAAKYFEDLGIEEGSIHDAQTTPEGRHAVRSLYRMFQEERPMARFLANFKNGERGRMDERPIDFITVASRALKWFEIRYHANQVLGETVIVENGPQWTSEFPAEEETASPTAEANIQVQKKQLDEEDPDQMQWYEMRMRELDRVKAFAKPVAEYLALREEAEKEKEKPDAA